MANVFFIQGSYHVQIAKLDSSGYAKGQATNPNSIAAGTSLPSYVVDHPVSVSTITPTRETATDRGGQVMRGTKDLGASDFGTIELVFSDYDMGFDNVVSSALTDTTTVSNWVQGAPNMTNPALPQVAVWFTGGAQGRNDSDYGIDKYQTRLYIGTIAPSVSGTSQSGGVNPNPQSYTLTATNFDTLPNGVTLASMSLGYSENIVHNMITADRIAFHTYVAAAADTEFTLPYLPLYDDATGAADNWITEDGVTGSVTSVNTSTGVVTIPSASGGEIFQVWYPTAFVASA